MSGDREFHLTFGEDDATFETPFQSGDIPFTTEISEDDTSFETSFESGNNSFETEFELAIPAGPVSTEQIGQAVKDYLENNPVETVTEYQELDGKPQINGVELAGNKTAEELGLQPKGNYLTEVPENYAKKEDIPTVPSNVSAFQNDAGYLTEHQDLSGYAKRTEIPAVPAWAMQGTKPTYTAAETGADAVGSAAQALTDANAHTDAEISKHNTSTDAHNDLRIFVAELAARVNALADSDDTTLDQMSEIVAYIKDNRELVEQVTTEKVSVTDIIDNLTTNLPNKVLSASMGVYLKQLIDAIVIPTKVSAFENDKGYLTEHQSLEDYAKRSELPTVPTIVSAFENDAGYLTQHQSLEGYATEQWVSGIMKAYFPQTVEFQQGKLYAPATSASYTAKTITDNSVTFEYRGGSGVEELIFPITGLIPGRTYTLSFDETYNGTYIQDTYRYGCGIMQASVYNSTTFPTNLSKPSWVVWHTDSTGTQKGSITFTAESDTVYWVWSLGRLSDGKIVTITFNAKVF